MSSRALVEARIQNTTTGARKDLNTDPRVKKMKRATIVYWTTTGIVCSVMVFSAINFNLSDPIGPMKGAFVHLGFPNYFKIELTVAKILGVLALLIPNVPSKIKEFAYFGFAITLVSASIAHSSSGDSIMFMIDPLIFLGILIISYYYFNKSKRNKDMSETRARSST
jgi:DoxX-like family